MTEVPKTEGPKKDVPKIVYDRLRAAQPKGAHPEADMLTAFAEQSLSATERDAVLDHVARCGDCRETVALALPASTSVAVPIVADSPEEVAAAVSTTRAPASRKPAFVWWAWAWPQLRWAALAAGVALAASVLLLQPGKVNHPNPASPSQIATAVPPKSVPPASVPPTSQPQSASSPATLASDRETSGGETTTGESAISATADETSTKRSSTRQSSTRQAVMPSAKQLDVAPLPPQTAGQIAPPSSRAASTAQSSTPLSMAGKAEAGKTDNARLNTGSVNSGSVNYGSKTSRQPQTGASAAPAYPVKSEVLIADSAKDSSDKAAATLPEAARALNRDASATPGTTEAVTVSGAAIATQKPSPAGDILMARNNAPAIVKAKEPSPGIAANEHTRGDAGSVGLQGRNVMSLAKLAAPAGSGGAHAVTWTITGGVLQRSLDSGQTWQTALHADHPLLCSASLDSSVWAGGQAGILFHSTDGGVTWVQVKPSIDIHKDQQLSSDVTHIDVRSSTQVVVSASNNEVWLTLDGGKTWTKKN